MTVRVAGIGSYLPPEVVTNHDLEKTMDTSDEWIRERSGIGERRVGGVTSAMAIHAAEAALADAGLQAGDIDFLILCTTTPDQVFPATSATVAAGLGIECGAMDVNVVCAGFPYAYVSAYGMMLTPGGPERMLVIGSDALSGIVDWTDRSTAILFGDGAGAVVLERHEQGEILAQDFAVNGDLKSILYCEKGDTIKMEGREVFKRAVRAVTTSVGQVLAKAGVDPSDVDVVLPHQANIRIIEAMAERIGIPMDKTFNVLERTGNTSSASIPLAMAAAHKAGALAPHRLVLMTGFGAGMAWGSVLLKW